MITQLNCGSGGTCPHYPLCRSTFGHTDLLSDPGDACTGLCNVAKRKIENLSDIIYHSEPFGIFKFLHTVVSTNSFY